IRPSTWPDLSASAPRKQTWFSCGRHGVVFRLLESSRALMASPSSIQGPVPTSRDYALLLLLGAIWGSSFLLIKVAVATVPPVTVAAGRVIVGAIFIAAVVALQRKRLPTNPSVWAKLSLMGTVGTVAPFALINWGETHID